MLGWSAVGGRGAGLRSDHVLDLGLRLRRRGRRLAVGLGRHSCAPGCAHRRDRAAARAIARPRSPRVGRGGAGDRRRCRLVRRDLARRLGRRARAAHRCPAGSSPGLAYLLVPVLQRFTAAGTPPRRRAHDRRARRSRGRRDTVARADSRSSCSQANGSCYDGTASPERSGLVTTCNFRPVSLRICFVTPFAWSQPHEVNAHVDGTAKALRARGHDVTILAPSSRGRDLLAGRRALQRGADAEVIAVGPSIPLSRRTNMGVPVAVRANLRLALTKGRFDVVHGFEPGLPSLSYLALTSTSALTAATFFSVDRLVYPARRSRRDRLRARVDALLATSKATAEAASERFEGEYRLVPLGVDIATFDAGVEEGRHRARAGALGTLDDTSAPATAPRPARLGGRAPPHEAARVPARGAASGSRTRARPRRSQHPAAHRRALGRCDLRRGARRRGAPRPRGGGVRRSDRRRSDRRTTWRTRSTGSRVMPTLRSSEGASAREHAERQSFDAVADELDELYARLTRKRRPRAERGRGPARRPRLDHDRPAHAHGLVARLLDSGQGARRSRARRSGSEGSRSPTTTSSAARSKQRSWRATAI